MCVSMCVTQLMGKEAMSLGGNEGFCMEYLEVGKGNGKRCDYNV